MKHVSRLRGNPSTWRRVASLWHALDPDGQNAAALRRHLVLLAWLVGLWQVTAVVGLEVVLFTVPGLTVLVIWSGLTALTMVCAFPCWRSILRRIDAIDGDDGRAPDADGGIPRCQPAGGEDVDWARFEEHFRSYSQDQQPSMSGR